MSFRSEVIKILDEYFGDSKKITDLPNGTFSDDVLFEAVQSGQNVKILGSQFPASGGGGPIGTNIAIDAGTLTLNVGGEYGNYVKYNLTTDLGDEQTFVINDEGDGEQIEILVKTIEGETNTTINLPQVFGVAPGYWGNTGLPPNLNIGLSDQGADFSWLLTFRKFGSLWYLTLTEPIIIE